MRIFLVASLLFVFAPQGVLAFGGKAPWDRKPRAHAFDLNEFNGTYRVASTSYSDVWNQKSAGKTRCPGEGADTIALRFQSYEDVRSGKNYYVDSIGFWTKADEGSQISTLEYIDQGTQVLKYSNGPSGFVDWLGCQLIPLSPDCDYGNQVNDEYYARQNIMAENTSIQTTAYTKDRTVFRNYQYDRETQFSDHTETTQEMRMEALALNGTDVTYTHSWDDQIVRVCLYKKVQ